MGGGSSKVTEEPYVDKSTDTAQSDLLKWKRCVYMSQLQYTKKSHINNNMLCITDITTDVDTFVINKIKDIASKLPNGKVPAPIYVMYAKKLEYNGTIFGDCIDEAQPYSLLVEEIKTLMIRMMSSIIPQTISINSQLQVANTSLIVTNMQLNMAKNSPVQFKDDNKISILTSQVQTIKDNIATLNSDKDAINAQSDTIKSRLVEITNLKKNFKCIKDDNLQKYLDISKRLFDDMKSLYSSELSKFTFDKNKNYQVVIYVPNLNSNNFYFSNFRDYTMHNEWMSSFIKDDLLLYNIISISDPTVDKLRALYDDPSTKSNQMLKSMIENIIRIFITIQEKQFPFVKELTQSCFKKGCVSDYGEDLDQIVPGFTKDAGQRKLNSNAKAPYYPSKCLRQPNYKENMFDDNDEFKKKMIDNLLGKCLEDYNNAVKGLDSSGTPPVFDTEPLLVDQFKKCAIQYRFKEKGNFNPDDGTDNYSVAYNQKILGELSLRKYSYPGVQEVIFPLFRLNETNTSVRDFITYMPWGNKLLTKDYALNINTDAILEDIPLKSMNDVYKLIIPTKNVPTQLLHKICVFKNNNIFYTLSDESFNNCFNKKLKFEDSGSLKLYGSTMIGGTPTEGLQWGMIVTDVSLALQPVSLGFNPDNGKLVVFDNGLNIVTSATLSNRMEKSMGDYLGSDYTFTPPDLPSDFDIFLNSLGYNLGILKKPSSGKGSKSGGDSSGSGSGSGAQYQSSRQDSQKSSLLGINTNRDIINTYIPELIYDDDVEMERALSLAKTLSILKSIEIKHFS